MDCSKFRYLKNLKLFSFRVRELSKPIVLWIKKATGLSLLIGIVLRNRCLSNAWWFYGKNLENEKENLYLCENQLSRNIMWCAANNHNYMCHTSAEEFFFFFLTFEL